MGQVNPGALDKLRREGHSVKGLESKSWDRFSEPGAPEIDIVITVCDNAAGEACPLWNGAPITVHWGIPDPAADGDFDAAYRRLRKRVEAMVQLPISEMDDQTLLEELRARELLNMIAGPVFSPGVIWAWAVLALLLFLYPLFGLFLERAPLRAYLVILSGPVFILWRTWLAFWARFSGKQVVWIRTSHGQKK